MLSEHRTLDKQVVVFMGPLNMSGYENTKSDEISYLTELSVEAGALIGSRINSLTTLCVTSELTLPEAIAEIPAGIQVLSEAEFMDNYLTEAMTGEEWE